MRVTESDLLYKSECLNAFAGVNPALVKHWAASRCQASQPVLQTYVTFLGKAPIRFPANFTRIAMGTPGVEVVRFCGRYYVRFYLHGGYYEDLGAMIVAKIPADPEEYQSTSLNYLHAQCECQWEISCEVAAKSTSHAPD